MSAELPKIIYSLWLQGRDAAPDLVRLCFKKWGELNPDYELRVLTADDMPALLGDTKVPREAVSVQALSDIVRARLLKQHGGVWADSSVLPLAPLRDWLPQAIEPSGFFAFERPGIDRPISSWFLAALPGNPIAGQLWNAVEHYWQKPRQLVRFAEGPPADPAALVAPDQGGLTDIHPYFWFHYLFQYLIETNEEFSALWGKRHRWPADHPHALQFLFAKNAPLSLFDVMEAAAKAPVQKLDWRASYPLQLLAELGGQNLPVPAWSSLG